MSIGELLRQYRMEQGKTQKEWTGTTVSPSYYSKVEKDVHRITVVDLLEILRANDVNPLDFFSRLNWADQVKDSQSRELARSINEAYYQNDEASLQSIRASVERSKLTNKEQQLLLLDETIAAVKDDPELLDQDQLQKVKEEIFNSDHINERQLRLFANLVPYYDLDGNLVIGRRLLEIFCHDSKVSIKEALLAMSENIIIKCIEQNRYADTSFFIQAADAITIVPTLFFYKNGLILLENMVAYHDDQRSEYLAKCQLAINNFTLLGLPKFGAEVQKFFDKYKVQ
ncbi:helix-turn-helix domain-containing protein [Lactobacillus xylocopicola]|uniref:HTH cro/C1-type domain-containing protein n=1 Tax=Lactobacillus xylocopicola TaxID=2976676 RepID=A0ABN6SLB9_9LACO|nr:Rgg/GadR/MutR family transcriptional regulator [Lactobacillus xylocopicola]BDR60994.1 hypothetical protein KIM322_12550 [Lactobacillus xylocopicola]